MHDLRPGLMLAAATAVLAIFVVAECMRRYARAKAEVTRKCVHVCAGLITLAFPYLFPSHYSVLLLCAGFLLLLLISRRYHFLDSVNAIRRRSFGSIVYPVIIYLCFLVYTQTGDLLFYYLPLLIFIICDPLAALAGMRTGWLPYRLGGDPKTVAGSLAFFISASILSVLLLVLVGNIGVMAALPYALLIAAAATLAEAVSPVGLDNLLVPLSILAVLYWLPAPA